MIFFYSPFGGAIPARIFTLCNGAPTFVTLHSYIKAPLRNSRVNWIYDPAPPPPRQRRCTFPPFPCLHSQSQTKE